MSTVQDTNSSGGAERRAQLLVIDDDNLQRMVVRELANQVGYDTTGAASYQEAADLLGHTDYDCITLDLSLGGRSGLELLQLFKQVRCDTPIIVISGSPEAVTNLAVGIGQRANLNMCTPIPKPVNHGLLREMLARIKKQSEAKPRGSLSLMGWTAEAR